MNTISTTPTVFDNLLGLFDNRYNHIVSFKLPKIEEFDAGKARDIVRDCIVDNFTYDTRQILWDRFLKFLYGDYGTTWMAPRGKWSKRLVKALPELNPYIGFIGNRLTRDAYHCYESSYHLSLTDTIFWEDGEFGHSGSCWFKDGAYPMSRYYWLQNNGIGMLWHGDNDDYQTGYARLWILNLMPEFHINGIALINQYGNHNHRAIRIDETADFLSKHLPNTRYERNELTTYNNIPYVNSSCATYIVDRNYADSLCLYAHWYDSNLGICYECDEIYNRYQLTEHPEHGDKRICSDCLSDNFTSCDSCSNDIRNDELQRGLNGEYLCHYCYNSRYYSCDDCNTTILRADVVSFRGYDICHDCYMNRRQH